MPYLNLLNSSKLMAMTKKLTFLIFIGILFVSCNKDSPIPDIYSGSATAEKNGEIWNAHVWFTEIEGVGFNIGFDVFDNAGIQTEHMTIFSVKKNFEKQVIDKTLDWSVTIKNFGVFYTTIVGGDAGGNGYDVDIVTSNSFFQVTEYNAKNEIMKGIFNLTLILTDRGNTGTITPPTRLKFIDGSFTVKVKTEWVGSLIN